jgi:hypothetical protein
MENGIFNYLINVLTYIYIYITHVNGRATRARVGKRPSVDCTLEKILIKRI